MGKYRSSFQKPWLNDTKFESWLREHTRDKFSAFCILCKKEFGVPHGGISDVKSHSNGKTHLALENRLRTREQTTLPIQFGKKPSSVENELIKTNSDRGQPPEGNIGSALATGSPIPFWCRFSPKYNP